MENAKSVTSWKIFKTSVLSKICRLALVTNIPTAIIGLLSKIQKEFLLWKNKFKIKHDTLCNDCEDKRLKIADTLPKIVSLQCSWIRRLYDENFHSCKIITLNMTEIHFGKNFKFHPNLDLRN